MRLQQRSAKLRRRQINRSQEPFGTKWPEGQGEPAYRLNDNIIGEGFVMEHMRKWTTRIVRSCAKGVIGAALTAGATLAADDPPVHVLFTNVNVFDGKSEKLAMGMSVLIEGNLIKQVGKDLKARDDAKTIDGGGRTLMPGFIDQHTHLSTFLPLAWAQRSLHPYAHGALATLRAKEILTPHSG